MLSETNCNLQKEAGGAKKVFKSTGVGESSMHCVEGNMVFQIVSSMLTLSLLAHGALAFGYAPVFIVSSTRPWTAALPPARCLPRHAMCPGAAVRTYLCRIVSHTARNTSDCWITIYMNEYT